MLLSFLLLHKRFIFGLWIPSSVHFAAYSLLGGASNPFVATDRVRRGPDLLIPLTPFVRLRHNIVSLFKLRSTT